jgi:hypothetical protein
MTSRSLRAIRTAAIAVPAVLVLAACSGGGAAPTTSPSARAGVVGERVDQPCAELVPASTFAVYGQSFSLDRSARPAKGSTAAQVAAQRGRVCTWRADDGQTITVAVAHLPATTRTALKDTLFEQGGSVPTYTVEGYFALRDGTGRADAFPDPYWITTTSTLFTEPGTAQPVVDAVRHAVAPGASAPAPSAAATP